MREVAALPELRQLKDFLQQRQVPFTEKEIQGAATGLRRGEVVVLRCCDLDLDGAELSVSGNVLFVRGLAGGRKGLKSEHGERLVALDARTVQLLRTTGRAEGALAVGVSLAEDSYLFTRVPDGARPIRPDAMTRRFGRLAASLGHESNLARPPPFHGHSQARRRCRGAHGARTHWPRQPYRVQHLHPPRERR